MNVCREHNSHSEEVNTLEIAELGVAAIVSITLLSWPPTLQIYSPGGAIASTVRNHKVIPYFSIHLAKL